MDRAVLREDMIDGLEHALGEVERRVVAAMRAVPRHEFVDEGAYDNREGVQEGSRVLAPATVARLVEAVAPEEGDEVLVVGAGVGYTAAVLAELVGGRRVHAIDIARQLVYAARGNLADAGYDAVLVDRRDGSEGLPEYAPFDRILVEAAAVRPPAALLDQLAADGRLVMPMGDGADQQLVEVGTEETEGYQVVADHGSVAFAPLLVDGEQPGGRTWNRTVREDREFGRQGHFAPTGWEREWIDWDERLDGGRGHRRP